MIFTQTKGMIEYLSKSLWLIKLRVHSVFLLINNI